MLKGKVTMTTIHFERTGGLLGKEIDFDLDLNQLPDEASQQIQRLIRIFFHRIWTFMVNPPPMSSSTLLPYAPGNRNTVGPVTPMPDALYLVAELTGIHAEQEKASAR
jgi:hypothetical protein